MDGLSLSVALPPSAQIADYARAAEGAGMNAYLHCLTHAAR
jgi:hypothetical protein